MKRRVGIRRLEAEWRENWIERCYHGGIVGLCDFAL